MIIIYTKNDCYLKTKEKGGISDSKEEWNVLANFYSNSYPTDFNF